MDDLDVIRAGIPRNDDCPVLTRVSAYIVQQGTAPILEHVFRKTNGNQVDLSKYLASAVSESVSASEAAPTGSVALRVKEWTAEGRSRRTNPIWTIDGYAEDASRGLLRAQLGRSITERPGIYELSWGIQDSDEHLISASQAMMSVERTLFPEFDATNGLRGGPITLGEIRTSLVDSGRADNLLLDDVEFSDIQLFQAMVAPVREWNEMPPPISTFTTRDFPYKGAWLKAILGHLHLMAAASYRRNFLNVTAGGLNVPDKNKEREYLAEGMRLTTEYTEWVKVKKIELNMKLVSGSTLSDYSRGRYY